MGNDDYCLKTLKGTMLWEFSTLIVWIIYLQIDFLFRQQNDFANLCKFTKMFAFYHDWTLFVTVLSLSWTLSGTALSQTLFHTILESNFVKTNNKRKNLSENSSLRIIIQRKWREKKQKMERCPEKRGVKAEPCPGQRTVNGPALSYKIFCFCLVFCLLIIL